MSFASTSWPVERPFNEVEHAIDGGRGIEMHAYDWGGSGPTLVLAHATGLHAHVWLPLVSHLRTSFRCIGVDLMAQGASSAPADGDLKWAGVASGLVAVLDALDLSHRGDVYGIGHSQGGYAVLEAELQRPGTFASLFVYEPVVFPPMPGMAPGDTWPSNAMSVLARRRRRTFASSDRAVANFSSKPPFEKCDAAVVESYVHWGFRPTGMSNDGGEVEIGLVCPPETEAGLFEGSVTDVFGRLGLLGCPVTYGLGEQTGSFTELVPRAAQATPNGRLLHLPGRTHFGIFEGTEEMAKIARGALLDGGGVDGGDVNAIHG